jgi:subtilisin family serine protease
MQLISKSYNVAAQFVLRCLPFFCFLAVFAQPACLSAQCKLSPEALTLLRNSERATRTSAVNSDSLIFAYIMVEDGADVELFNQYGVSTNVQAGNFITAQMPVNVLHQVAELPFVRYIQLARTPRTQLDKAHQATQMTRVQAGELGEQAYTGEGIVIGVIDAGFDYSHPAFSDPATGKLRISRVWEQSATGTPPAGFTYGTEFQTSDEILASGGDIKYNSHGSHVACIAAGSHVGNEWYGVAPDAELVLVGMSAATPNNVNISDALAYIYNYAESVGKPCVINMSLGAPMGPHDGTSPFDQIADALQGKGRLLVGSAGNSGAQKLHISRTFSSAEDEPLQTMFDFKEKPDANNAGGEVDIWGSVGMQFQLSLHVFNCATGKFEQSSESILVGEDVSRTTTFELTKSSKGTITVQSEVNPINGKPHAMLTLGVTSLKNKYAVALVVTPLSAGRVDAWADNDYLLFTNNALEGWQDGDTECTIGEIGGTGKKLVTVGAYTTRTEYTQMGSGVVETIAETLGDKSSFSAAGPTVDGRLKPEISAPGAYIISALSSHDVSSTAVPRAASVIVGDKEYYYGYMQGTSMAAPYVTGLAALLLQADAQLSPADFKKVLVGTAMQDDFTGTLSQGNPIWGFGKVNAYEALRQVINTLDMESVTSTSRPVIHRNGDEVKILFSKAVGDVTLTILDTSGRIITRTVTSANRGEDINFSFADLPAGIYILSLRTNDDYLSVKVSK